MLNFLLCGAMRPCRMSRENFPREKKFAARMIQNACSEVLESRTLLSASAANLTQFHYDAQSTGQNSNETVLTPANANSTDFGKIFTTTLDGQVYASVLAVANVNITRSAIAGNS